MPNDGRCLDALGNRFVAVGAGFVCGDIGGMVDGNYFALIAFLYLIRAGLLWKDFMDDENEYIHQHLGSGVEEQLKNSGEPKRAYLKLWDEYLKLHHARKERSFRCLIYAALFAFLWAAS